MLPGAHVAERSGPSPLYGKLCGWRRNGSVSCCGGVRRRDSSPNGAFSWRRALNCGCAADGSAYGAADRSMQTVSASDEAVVVNDQSWDIDMTTTLDLDNIRSTLVRLEDTILFALIERAQFPRNDAVYTSGKILVPGFSKETGARYSLLEYLLRETEQIHGKIRRYTSPDEHPFYPDDVPALVLPPLSYRQILPPSVQKININDRILKLYIEVILPKITVPGNDNNYGSSALCDVLCLQALSKRIHYAKWVAEAKYAANPAEYTTCIKNQDAEAIMQTLTNNEVEEAVVKRVRLKASAFGQDITNIGDDATNGRGPYKIHPDTIADLYANWVIPLTKELQQMVLLRRFDDQ